MLKNQVVRILRFLASHPYLLVPFVFYGLTRADTIQSVQTITPLEFIWRGDWSSFVNCHNLTNLFIRLSMLLPFGEVGEQIHLVSVLFGSLTVSLFYWTLFRQMGSKHWAAVSASLLMVCHGMWWNSTVLEVYAVNAFFTVLAIHLFWRFQQSKRDHDLYWIFFVAGLSVFNHVAMGFLGVGALLCLGHRLAERKEGRASAFTFSAAAGFAGILPWLGIVIKDWIVSGDLALTLRDAFVGPFSNLMGSGSFQSNLTQYLFILFVEYPNGLALIAVAGAIVLGKRWWRSPSLAGLAAFFLMNTFFFASYRTWNKFSHLLPSLVILAYFGAIGLHWVVERVNSAKASAARAALVAYVAFALVLPPWLYSRIGDWAQDARSVWAGTYGDAGHQCVRIGKYIIDPNKRGFRDYQRFADLLMEKLPPNSIYLDSDSLSYHSLAFYNQRVQERRLDLRAIEMNSFGYDDANWGMTPRKVADLIRKAREYDRDLFVVTRGWPFSRAIDQLPAGAGYSFERFPLEEGCWVYRLTKPEGGAGRVPASEAAPAITRIEAGATIDLTRERIALASDVELTDQPMDGFGSGWTGGQQVLVQSHALGQWVELILESDREQVGDLVLNLTQSWDYGKVSMYLNGEQIVDRLDLYSPDVRPLAHRVPQAHLKAGRNSLLIRVRDRNPASSSYLMGLDSLRLDTQGEPGSKTDRMPAVRR